MEVLFYIASVIAIASSVMTITRAHAVHALIYMVVSLLSVAVVFYLLGAPFVAALEVIIYAGAIMVLFIFVVMILNMGSAVEQERKLLKPGMWIIPAVLSLILLVEFLYVFLMMDIGLVNHEPVTPKAVGTSLFSKYLLGVEITALLLMAGIVGAYHLGKREKKVVHRFLKEEGETE